MPKETIRSADNEIGVPNVEVRWGKDEASLQIAVAWSDEDVTGWLGDAVHDYRTSEYIPTPRMTEEEARNLVAFLIGWGLDQYVTTLDRAGINALIRVLRKARDQACGADA